MKARPRKVQPWLRVILIAIVALAVMGVVSVINTSASPILRTVAVGQFPSWPIVSVPQGRLFIPNTSDGTVSVLDTRTGQLLRTTSVGIQAGQFIWNVAADAPSDQVFVRTGDDVLTTLDATSGAVVRTLSLGACSRALAVDARVAHIFTANCLTGIVRMIDARSGRLVTTIHIGGQPQDIAVDEQTGRVFVVDGQPSGGQGPGRMTVRDAASGRVMRRLRLSAPPSAVALDIRTQRLVLGLVGRTDSTGQPTGIGRVEVLDARSLRILRTIPVGIVPWAIAVDPRTDHAFVVNANITPSGNNYSQFLPTNVKLPEDGWHATARRVKKLLPWLPLRLAPPPAPSPNGSVTVLDLTQL